MNKSTTKTDGYVSIIVYGTLMKGFGNHSLIADCEFLGDGTFKGSLYDMMYGFPAVLRKDEDLGNVIGEVYKVPVSRLARLDMLEGYREHDEVHSMYLRKDLEVKLIGGGIEKAYVYIWNRTLPPNSKKWESHKKWNRD